MHLQDMDTDLLIDHVVKLNIWLQELPPEEVTEFTDISTSPAQSRQVRTDSNLNYRRDVLINSIIDARIELRKRFISSPGS